MELIQRILQEIKQSGIRHYRINAVQKQTAELFYVKRDLDMARQTDTTDCTVTVYRDFESGGVKMRGSADAVVYPDLSAEEIKAALQSAFYAASFVKNKFYELPKPDAQGDASCQEQALDLTAEAFRMADAIYAAEEQRGSGSFLNSAEVFAVRNTCTICNSEGVNVRFVKYSFEGEFVAQCIANGQDVELYEHFSYREPSGSQLTALVKTVLKSAEDRAAAFEAPKGGKYALLLSGTNVREVLEFYLARTNSSAIYAGYSSFQEGCYLQGEETICQGEKLDIDLKAAAPYSAEGIRMQDRPLAKQGILHTIHGGARFAYYLGISPTGNYSAVSCGNGALTMEELQSGLRSEDDRVLHVAVFSDFQMDPFSGVFGGEIRLAYLYEKKDGKMQRRILTGGSVSGNILQVQNSMVFSNERYQDDRYTGPYAVRFDNMNVAGV